MKGSSRFAGRVCALIVAVFVCRSAPARAAEPAAVSTPVDPAALVTAGPVVAAPDDPALAPAPGDTAAAVAPTPGGAATPVAPAAGDLAVPAAPATVRPERSDAADAGSRSRATGAATPDAPSLPASDGAIIVGRRSRTEARRDRTASATVISADRFAGEAKGVAELVATAPGVAVNDYGGLGRLATASIRGSTAENVLVLLDGIPLNSAFGGGVNLSSIPRGWIDRIEVIRGVEGAHYGAGALGGVVNVITRRPAPGAWTVELSGGSFGTFGGSADAGVGVGGGSLVFAGGFDTTKGDFGYRRDMTESVAGGDQDFTRAHNGAARGGGLAKLALPLGAAQLDGLAQVSAGHRDLPPDPGHDAEGSRDWQEDARGLLALRLAAPAAGWLTLAGRGTFRFDRDDLRLTSVVRRQTGTAPSAGVEALVDHPGGALRLEVEGGAERIDAGDAGGVHSRRRYAAAASEELHLASGRLRIAPAARYEGIGAFHGLSSKLGARLAVWGPVSIRASAGRSFRAPSFSELYLQQGLAQPNPALRAEVGEGVDAAVVADGALGVLSVGGHATRYSDLVVWQPATFRRLKPFNTGRSFVGGVEAEGATAPMRALAGLTLSGAYTWQRTENLRGPEGEAGNDLPRRPRHRLYARASVAPGPIGLHVEVQRVGAQWADARNALRVPATSIWNAGASLALTRDRSASLSLEVRNALDDRALVDPLDNPLPGRMVLLALRVGPGRTEVTP